MTADHTGEDIAMQTRCVNCLCEQYILNVLAVSNGEAGCYRCGHNPGKLTDAQWRAALADARRKRDRR